MNNFIKLAEITGAMRYIAQKKGPSHYFWDVISENETFLEECFSISIIKDYEKVPDRYNKLIYYSVKCLEDM